MKRKPKQTRSAILSRIRYHNKNLSDDYKIDINARKLSYNEIRNIEKNIKTRLELEEANIEIDKKTILETKDAEQMRQLARARNVNSKDLIVKQTNKIIKDNQDIINQTKDQFAKLKGFGILDFVKEAFNNKRTSASSMQLYTDSYIVAEAITNPNLFKDYLKMTVEEANKVLKHYNQPQIKFDENNIDNTIKELNAMDVKMKKFVKPPSPKETQGQQSELIEFEEEFE